MSERKREYEERNRQSSDLIPDDVNEKKITFFALCAQNYF